MTAEEAVNGLSPDVTGYAVSDDNTGITMNSYEFVKTGESEIEILYDAVITASDLCGNDSTLVQKVTVDKPTGMPMADAQGKCPLKIYPNPAEGSAAIEYSANGGKATVSITSMSGQTLESFALGQNRVKHNFSRYAPGVYTVRVVDGGKTCSASLVIR